MRKMTLKNAKKHAWRQFSNYIKERDKYTCVTCGASGRGSWMHAGHFVPATRSGTWLDENNVFAQCGTCNIWARGNAGAYAKFLIARYGVRIIEELVTKSHQPVKYTVTQLQEIAETYKKKLDLLIKQ